MILKEIKTIIKILIAFYKEKKMKIIVDGFGGDNAPLEIVKGIALALDKYKDLSIVVTGDENAIKALIQEYKIDKNRIEVIHTTEIISNNESPTEAIRSKKDSSLVVALEILKKEDEVIGLVSAGSTGAVLTGAFMKLGRMKGVSRPALAPTLPTKNGKQVVLIDCGANMDAKPINLCHFALMGSAYVQHMYGISNPRVALLNVGVENEKGNELCHQTFPLLKNLDINFVGNMEARDFLSGDYDVVVSDGFSGNVLLKSTEGAILLVLSLLKTSIKARKMSKFGALFMRKTFKDIKKNLNYENKGGSPFLGAKKIVIKSHGSSMATSIFASIEQVIDINNKGVYNSIDQAVANAGKICDDIEGN